MKTKRLNPKLIWAGIRAVHLALKLQKDFDKCNDPVKKQLLLIMYDISLFAIKSVLGDWMHSKFNSLELPVIIPEDVLLQKAKEGAEQEAFNQSGFKA